MTLLTVEILENEFGFVFSKPHLMVKGQTIIDVNMWPFKLDDVQLCYIEDLDKILDARAFQQKIENGTKKK